MTQPLFSQLHSYNRHTLVADPFEDGMSDLLIKKQRMIELEKKVRYQCHLLKKYHLSASLTDTCS